MTAASPLHRSRDDVYGEQLFRVEDDDLQPGTYTIGIFNMDYFVHQSFSYQLAVRGADTAWPMTLHHSLEMSPRGARHLVRLLWTKGTDIHGSASRRRCERVLRILMLAGHRWRLRRATSSA